MRCAVALGALLVLLSGCKREPTFEERYEAANHTVVERAKQIDAQIAGTGAPPADSALQGDAQAAP
ncbi:hypothetical protein [Novosphingobium soli]|uniref:Lipoprotein n=1 Tax=Novosphingobium soli TaxID=574956 RepID=A0ABV6CTY7_9SPHN